MRHFLIAAITLFYISTAVAADCDERSESQYRAILTTDTLKESAVGYAGITPEEVLEFRCILKRPDAKAVFTQLLKDATTPGKLYALTGLYITDKVQFQREAEKFKSTTVDVNTMRGCIIGREKFASLLKEIERGVWSQQLVGAGNAANSSIDRTR